MTVIDPTKRLSEKKRFSLIARARSVSYALRGISIIVRTQHNIWVQACVACCVVILGWYYHISQVEWMALVLASTIVFVAESINTAIEIDIDLTSPEYHPYARDTKDVAAGAVLVAVCGAIIVGIFIFIPKMFDI
jgi:diacylglycerol kinase